MWRHQKTRSVCVKQALNTRRWLVNALVTWNVSYKITTLLLVHISSLCRRLSWFATTLDTLTTGLPKGICHSHWSALHFFGYAKTLVIFDAPSVATTCFFHVGGFLTGTLALERRNTFHHVSKVKKPILLPLSIFYSHSLNFQVFSSSLSEKWVVNN